MIREPTTDDAEQIAALQETIYPEFVRSVAAVRYYLELKPPGSHMRRWCAEAGGELIGLASASLNVQTSEKGVAWIDVIVDPSQRARGIGGALYELAERHTRDVGARRILAESRADDASVAFAQSRAYEQIASHDLLRLDPRTVQPVPLRPGVEVLSFAAFVDDPTPLHRVDAAATLDEPGGVTWDAITYEHWLADYWNSPSVDRDASMAALVDGEVASITWLRSDHASGRATNAGTGTHPDHRGRGLATVAKRASLVRAAELGISAVYTGNDATNAPMQAINRKLGYQPFSTEIAWEKSLTPATSEP